MHSDQSLTTRERSSTDSNRPPRILVVEDESIVATDLERSLKRLGYDVLEPAASANEAIAAAEHGHPDLVLMDVRIEGDRDGIEAAAQLRRLFNLPVVYLTAYGDSPTLERAKRTEPLGYLLKPFKPRDLRSTVELALYRHRVETELRHKERWLRTTLDSIADAVIATDESGHITLLNQQARRLLQLEEGDVLGTETERWVRLLSMSDERPVELLLRTALFNLRPASRQDDVLLARPKGERVCINDNAAPIIDGEELLGGVMAFRDVTERHSLRQALELKERLAAMGTLAAGVAHEVNNPLMAVAANLEFADTVITQFSEDGSISLSADDVVELKSAVDDARYNANRIRDIVSDLRGFTRRSDTSSTAHVGKVVRWAVGATASAFKGKGTVDVEVATETPVRMDETRLGQVLVNLLVNAAQAFDPTTLEHNRVVLSATQHEPATVQIRISDNGPGIPAALVGHVFEPFVTTKPSAEGTGLGLFVTHNIVTSAGGRIDVSSGSDGTTFRIELPSDGRASLRTPDN